ncbi:MAG: tetratricopeptide repeat protein, partial [bacterium]
MAAILARVQAALADGDSAGALTLLDAALVMARRDPDSTARGLLQRGLGDVHAQSGRADAALRQYEDAITALRLAGNAAAEADTWLSAGDAQRTLQRPEKAAQAYATAGALFESVDDPCGAGHSQFRRAGLAGAERADTAEAHYARAVELYTEAADRQSGGLRLTNPHLPDVVQDSR